MWVIFFNKNDIDISREFQNYIYTLEHILFYQPASFLTDHTGFILPWATYDASKYSCRHMASLGPNELMIACYLLKMCW